MDAEYQILFVLILQSRDQVFSEPNDLLLGGDQAAGGKRQTVSFILENQHLDGCCILINSIPKISDNLEGQVVVYAME